MATQRTGVLCARLTVSNAITIVYLGSQTGTSNTADGVYKQTGQPDHYHTRVVTVRTFQGLSIMIHPPYRLANHRHMHPREVVT